MVVEDNAVMNMFEKQQEIDKENFLNSHRHLSNQDFVEKFYHFMAEKYDWRDWFVAAYIEVFP